MGGWINVSQSQSILQVVVSDCGCPKVFSYDKVGHEIPKRWYTFIDIGGGLIEAEFKEKLTYGAAVQLGKRHCEVNGFEYIGTCDIFGRHAMREFATDKLLSG